MTAGRSTRPPGAKNIAAMKNTRPISHRERKLTVAEIVKDLGISTRTFYRWKKEGTAPETFTLPGGGLRIYESVYTAWLEARSVRGAR